MSERLQMSLMEDIQTAMEEIFPDVINLNVGGTLFTTTRATLVKDPNSMLAALFSGRYKVPKDQDGRYFIDRDGSNFSHILAFLRENGTLPPAQLALQVLNDAEYFQLQGLIDALEIYPTVFRDKLQHSLNEKFQIGHWKREMIIKGQNKCLENLSSSSKLIFISEEEFEMLSDEPSCVGAQHDILVTKNTKNGLKQSSETFDYLANRLASPDFVIQGVSKKEIDSFVSIIQKQLNLAGYDCRILDEKADCVKVENVYGYRKEKCDFKLRYFQLEFSWDC